MLKRIIAYILFGLGILILLFFRAGIELIPYPFFFWVLGLSCFVIGLYVLRRTPTAKEYRTIEQFKKRIADLKATGEKIKIDFSKCDIKENNYMEERERYGNESDYTLSELGAIDIEREIQFWNALTDPKKNTQMVQVNQTVLIYKQNYNSKAETFYSRVIPRDRTNLLFKLDAQKTTTLYVDRRDRTNYYFDLDFLDN